MANFQAQTVQDPVEEVSTDRLTGGGGRGGRGRGGGSGGGSGGGRGGGRGGGVIG